MTRLQFFDAGYGLIAVKLGLLPLSILIRYDAYKAYADLVKKGTSTTEARKIVAYETGYSQPSISRAITLFEDETAFSK